MTKVEFEERRAYRRSIMSMLSGLPFTHSVTLNINGDATVASAKKLLKDFHARLDAKLLGRDWANKKAEERTSFAAFFEHEEKNLHAHLILMPAKSDAIRFEQEAPSIWLGLVPGGSSCIKRLDDQAGWARYITKEIEIRGVIDTWVLSTEFQNAA